MLTRATWPDGVRVTYRSLTWGEFREAQELIGPPAEKALGVYKLCVVDGPDVEHVPAGIMMWIYTAELAKSPFAGSFQALSRPLQQYRDKITGSYLLCAQALIASVFKIPFSDMDTWTSDIFFTRLAQAEFVSGVPLNPVDPTVPVDAKGKPVRKAKKPIRGSEKESFSYVRDNNNTKSPGPTKGGP